MFGSVKRSVTFLFKAGRKERLSANDGPTEFFYGAAQLKSGGHTVEILDEFDLDFFASSRWLPRAVGWLPRRLFGVNFTVLFLLFADWRQTRLGTPPTEAVVATTNSFALALAALKRLGRIKVRTVGILMGLCERTTPRRHIWFYRQLLRDTTVVVFSRTEAIHLRNLFGSRVIVEYVPFGVDVGFWSRVDPVNPMADSSSDYVVAIGNDKNRDFATLVDAWQPNYPQLRIVTRLPIESTAENIEIIRGDWHQQALSDIEVRSLIQNALFAVVPSKNTMQPAGQSACLQAMACGRAVVLSNIDGLWEPDLVRDGENCILVDPGSVDDMRSAVARLVDDQTLRTEIGRRAAELVREKLNVATMAAGMNELIWGHAESPVRATAEVATSET